MIPEYFIIKFKRAYDENQNDVINRRNGQGPKHLKFFLLVFAKDEVQTQSPSPRKPKSKPRGPRPNIK